MNSTLTNNSSQGAGGAIYFDSFGNGLLEDNSFSNNTAASGGAVGVLQNSNLNLTILDNTFSGNSATQTGGAMSISYGGAPQIITENNTFYNNLAGFYGGAIYSEGFLTSENNTFSNNQANYSAGTGGASLFIASGGLTVLYNNIFANGIAGWECSTRGSPDILGGHNLVDDGSPACLPLLTGDPQLGPLGDYGGPTLTMALLPGSPAIDAGDDTNCPLTDQRGVTRPQGAHCDIGSYEYEANPTPTPTP